MADAATKELRRRECAESYQSDTEKHLRDRIAQTLYRRYAPQLGMADNPWEDEHSLTQEMWREDADAVIRELPELRRIAQVREVCLASLNRDIVPGEPLSDRAWLADTVLNVLNGEVDKGIGDN